MNYYKLTTAALASTIMLAGCNSFDEYFSSTDRTDPYYQNQRPITRTVITNGNVIKEEQAARGGEVTTRVEPGHSTVSNSLPKTKATTEAVTPTVTTTTTTQQGPAVPNMAPSVNQ